LLGSFFADLIWKNQGGNTLEDKHKGSQSAARQLRYQVKLQIGHLDALYTATAKTVLLWRFAKCEPACDWGLLCPDPALIFISSFLESGCTWREAENNFKVLLQRR